jgi:hypothetical protein
VVLLVMVGSVTLAGMVAAVVLSGRRWFYGALVLVGCLLAVYMTTIRDRPYTQQRLVQLLLPLVLLVAAAGWDGLCRHTRSRESRAPRAGSHLAAPARHIQTSTALVGVGLAAAASLVVANAHVDDSLDMGTAGRERHVGPEFAEAAGWIRSLGDHQGDEAMVLVGDFFSQLWITDALRDVADVAYPALYPDYQYQNSYWDGQPRRWLLVDRYAIRSVRRHAVVRQNSRFALIDLSRASAVVAVPADVAGQNSYLILRSAKGPSAADLIGSTRARTPTDVPPAPGYGAHVQPSAIGPGTTEVRVEFGDAMARRIVLSDEDAVFVVGDILFG